jgi:hypothetical protein
LSAILITLVLKVLDTGAVSKNLISFSSYSSLSPYFISSSGPPIYFLGLAERLDSDFSIALLFGLNPKVLRGEGLPPPSFFSSFLLNILVIDFPAFYFSTLFLACSSANNSLPALFIFIMIFSNMGSNSYISYAISSLSI